jgi:hypothetical protein
MPKLKSMKEPEEQPAEEVVVEEEVVEEEVAESVASRLKFETPDGKVHTGEDLKELGSQTLSMLATAVAEPATNAVGTWLQMGIDAVKGAAEGALGEREPEKKDKK